MQKVGKYQWHVSVVGAGVLANLHFLYCFAAGEVDG